MTSRALTLLFIGIALIVTTVWIILMVNDPERAAGVTVLMTGIVAGCVSLLGKVNGNFG
jgi:uncharacterized membrane protein YqjE